MSARIQIMLDFFSGYKNIRNTSFAYMTIKDIIMLARSEWRDKTITEQQPFFNIFMNL